MSVGSRSDADRSALALTRSDYPFYQTHQCPASSNVDLPHPAEAILRNIAVVLQLITRSREG